jgi:molecular chaperone GrpE
MTTNDNDAQPVPAPPAPDTALPAPADELNAVRKEAADNWDKFLRATADLDNYRKRVARERDELARNVRENVIGALLPALDNLERALEHSEDGTPLHEGLLQVRKQFDRTLADFGLVEIIARPGDAFDAKTHEAVSHVAHADHADGIVIEQLQSGYRLGDRLLRPARVVVSAGQPQPPAAPTA